MVTLDVSADDFLAAPLGYPGTAPGRSVLVIDGTCLDLDPRRGRGWGQADVRRADGTLGSLDETLVDGGVAPVDRRTPVVSIGSNASLAVLRRKLAAGRVSTTFPVLETTVSGVAVGHSAHVSTPGYIPAAPFARAGARTTAYASLLDDDQLRCLDATEPNYTRLVRDGYHLYASAHGVIAPPGRAPLAFGTQAAVYRRLAAECRPLASIFGGLEPESVACRLSRDAALRDDVRQALADEGWSRDCRSRLETETDSTDVRTRAPAGPSNAQGARST